MTCDEALIAISAALDGEADEWEQSELEAHLAQCPECRAIADDFGLISAALSEGEELPAGLTGRMEQALNTADAGKKKPNLWKRYGGLAAMLAVVLCLGGLFAMQGGQKKDAAMEYFSFDGGFNGSASNGSAAAGVGIFTGDYSVVADSADAARVIGEQDGPAASASAQIVENKAESQSSAPAIAPVTPPEKETVQYDPPDHATIYSALKLVFEELGGSKAYPNLCDKDYYYFVLERTENRQTGATSELKLEYAGLSENGKYLTFALRLYTQDKEAASLTMVNNYAVSKELDKVICEYAENRSDADHVKAYRQAISE